MTKYEALQTAIDDIVTMGRYLMKKYPKDYEEYYRQNINAKIAKIQSRMNDMSIVEANEILYEF